MPSGPDREVDDSMFTYGLKQSKTSESDTQISNYDSFWPDAPIIEEYESDSDDEYVIQPSKEQERPSFSSIDTVKHVKTPRETIKEQNTYSPSPKANKRDWNGLISKSQAVSTSVARKVNAAKPIVNENRPRNNFYKSHLPIRRPFNKTTSPRNNFSNHKVNTVGVKAVSAVRGIRETADNPQRALKNKGVVDSGRSRHMTGNKAYLAKYQDYNGSPVAFGGSKGYITDTECLVLSSDFKLPDENQVLLRIHRQNNMYSFNIENIVPFGGLACLIAKATFDESNKWHRRLGHVNFKNLNKLVKGNLVREFKNSDFIEFCGSKGIKKEYSNVRTPQQNRVAKRKNMTLIEAAR
ncbi:ribonuclease H-like domain-containing protein, partial [Tanacetum coccineum]